METDRSITVEDDDYDDEYDNPAIEAFYTTLCRSDDREYQKKELSRKTKKLK